MPYVETVPTLILRQRGVNDISDRFNKAKTFESNRKYLTEINGIYENLSTYFRGRSEELAQRYNTPHSADDTEAWKTLVNNVRHNVQRELKLTDMRKNENQTMLANISDTSLLFSPKKSKYGKIYDVVFSSNKVVESSHETTEYLKTYLPLQGGVETTKQFQIDMDDIESNEPSLQLHSSFSEMANGSEAENPEVKPTKINLTLHSDDGGFYVRDFSNNGRKVIEASQLANYIGNHLPTGDYKGKLTIKLNACGVAAKPSGDSKPSHLEVMRNTLTNINRTNIKLTGLEGAVFVRKSIISNSPPLGTIEDSAKNKSSQSSEKLTLLS